MCAGAEHTNTAGTVERLVPLFEEAGARLVLSGHEHDFRHAVVNDVHYVVSGAAGKLRTCAAARLRAAGMHAWAVASHFLLVEAGGRRPVVLPSPSPRATDGPGRSTCSTPGGRGDPVIEIR